jgi:hypothetical protein
MDLATYPLLEAYGRSVVYGSPQTLFDICDTWGAASYDGGDTQPFLH